MDRALANYVPLSLREVELFKTTDYSWENVGGLTTVKEQLIEIFQWPSKVSVVSFFRTFFFYFPRTSLLLGRREK